MSNAMVIEQKMVTLNTVGVFEAMLKHIIGNMVGADALILETLRQKLPSERPERLNFLLTELSLCLQLYLEHKSRETAARIASLTFLLRRDTGLAFAIKDDELAQLLLGGPVLRFGWHKPKRFVSFE